MNKIKKELLDIEGAMIGKEALGVIKMLQDDNGSILNITLDFISEIQTYMIDIETDTKPTMSDNKFKEMMEQFMFLRRNIQAFRP